MSPGATAVQRTDSPLLGIVVGDANRGRHADLRVLGHKMMTWIAGRLYQYGDGNATTFVVVGWIGIFVGLFSTSYGKQTWPNLPSLPAALFVHRATTIRGRHVRFEKIRDALIAVDLIFHTPEPMTFAVVDLLSDRAAALLKSGATL